MKKRLYIITVVILSLTIITSMGAISVISGSAESGLLRGDADLNGKVDIVDVTIIQQSLAKLTQLSDDAVKCADVDSDGNVSIADATYIQMFLADLDNKYGINEYIDDENPSDTSSEEESSEESTAGSQIPSDSQTESELSSQAETETSAETQTQTETEVKEVTWEDNTGTIVLSDSGIAVTGENISVSGNVVTITDGGDWTVTGSCSNGMIYVNTGETKDANDKVKLRLSGMSLTNTSGPAIYFDRCKKAFITLTEGCENTLKDGSVYSDENSEAKGVVHSDDSLEIKGKGTLNVVGSYKHAINSDDDIEIGNGTLNLTANVSDGLHANDQILIDGKNVKISINSRADGIQCEDDKYEEEPDESGIRIYSGTLKVISGDKGIVSDQLIEIKGGTITVDSADDAIHSNNDIEISGGTLNLSAGDDGIHSDTILNITGGSINIYKSYEGLESYDVDISDGTIYINSSDDAVNGAGGNDQSGGESSSTNTSPFGGGPGGQSRPGGSGGFGGGGGFNPGAQSSSSGSIEISGGYIYALASGDGLDANGALNISGGTVIVQQSSGGNCCLDADSGITYTGGTVLGISPSGAMWNDVRVNGKYTINTRAGSVSEDSRISILSGSTVLTSVKSNLSGSVGIVYLTDSVSDLSSIKYNLGGTYTGDTDDFGVGSGGSVSGGTNASPTYRN